MNFCEPFVRRPVHDELEGKAKALEPHEDDERQPRREGAAEGRERERDGEGARRHRPPGHAPRSPRTVRHPLHLFGF